MSVILSYISYIWRVSTGFRRITALRTFLGSLRVFVMLAFVWFSKAAIDCATGRTAADSTPLTVWFALMVACMLADLLMGQWVKYLETRARVRMTNSLNRKLFNQLMTQPLVHGLQGYHSGDMLNRLTIDVRTVTTFALSQLPATVVMLIQLVGSFIFLSYFSPYLAIAPVVIMPLCLLAGKVYFRKQRTLTSDIRHTESDIHIEIQEGLHHNIVLRTLECLAAIDLQIGNLQNQLDDSTRRQARLSAVSGTLTRLGFAAGFLVAFGWGIFSLKAGIITFGTMTAFLQLVNRIQNPIATLAGYVPSFISTSVAIDRLREIDTPTAHNAESNPPLARAGVRVNDVTFSYDDDNDHKVLSHFSHDFTPGSHTLIMGETGVGKSTLIKLLLGLLSPNSGRIEIYDSTHTEAVSATTISNFSYVPQGNSLLHGTILENLLLAAPDATDVEIAKALHVAAADFVFDLPQGLNTRCDESGAGLSEGQAQRIAIARALLRPGSILLLDEFNSALDVDTATTLMRRLAAHRPDATLIIIAHHQSAIAPYCDKLVTIT